MPLTLTLKNESLVPIEVDTVRLETVRDQSPAEVLATEVLHGNVREPLGSFFDAKGSAGEDNTLVWEGDCHRIKRIAAQLGSGTIRVEGNAGMHLGAEMTGGEVFVSGNATDWVGAEMKGGRIHICGNAGHQLGAVYRGGHRGMTGGEILVDGNVGNETGQLMRRGLIAIAGNIGDLSGVNLIAGTIIVGGEAGIRHGAGMKRGTIAFLNPATPLEILPTFRSAGLCRPTFLRLYLKHLAECGWQAPDGSLEAEYHRYNGDFLELGKGELLVRSA
ncbi:MAG: formylmethanofuran dehydrogenase subunit C [Planctomycetota bacterium]|nr:formylmethanofuran dehydrogenase subunit C [Planctomycetota bacterium]